MKTDYSCINCPNVDCLIKNGCSSLWLEKISSKKRTSLYRKEQHVFHEGSRVLGLYFILNGSVKVYSSGINNKIQIVRFAKKPGILGHRGLGDETYPIGAIAVENSTICFVNNDLIFDTLLNNTQLTFNLMMYYSSELRKSEMRIKELSQMNVREKVADTIKKLISLYGIYSDHQIIIDVELNRQDIADFAGINNEQLSRILSEFKKDGIIDFSSKKLIVLQQKQLIKMVEVFG